MASLMSLFPPPCPALSCGIGGVLAGEVWDVLVLSEDWGDCSLNNLSRAEHEQCVTHVWWAAVEINQWGWELG